ncbi:MAG: hypothetical protein LBV36_09080 [Chromatiales bacterium]|jgi:hypothetical protein|nr:hypothetical protein [Chromatiales bacterium]
MAMLAMMCSMVALGRITTASMLLDEKPPQPSKESEQILAMLETLSARDHRLVLDMLCGIIDSLRKHKKPHTTK